MVTAAGTSGEAIKGAMAQLGGACSACHQAYRQPED
jgi:cytochrome c556